MREPPADMGARGGVAGDQPAVKARMVTNASCRPHSPRRPSRSACAWATRRTRRCCGAASYGVSIAWEPQPPRETAIGSLLVEAAVQELGNAHVPAQSYLAATAREKDAVLFRLFEVLYRRGLNL
jgi:hypothetical protein